MECTHNREPIFKYLKILSNIKIKYRHTNPTEELWQKLSKDEKEDLKGLVRLIVQIGQYYKIKQKKRQKFQKFKGYNT